MFPSGYPILFPPEILDQADDKLMLLSFGRALVKSRRRLFSSLEFTDHENFAYLLHLAGKPWTSFTLAVTEIHLQDVFHHSFRYYYKWEPIQVADRATLSGCPGCYLPVGPTRSPDRCRRQMAHGRCRDAILAGFLLL